MGRPTNQIFDATTWDELERLLDFSPESEPTRIFSDSQAKELILEELGVFPDQTRDTDNLEVAVIRDISFPPEREYQEPENESSPYPSSAPSESTALRTPNPVPKLLSSPTKNPSIPERAMYTHMRKLAWEAEEAKRPELAESLTFIADLYSTGNTNIADSALEEFRDDPERFHDTYLAEVRE